jgi:hypothetical protein
MAIPWLLALKVIPWGTILANAPAILRSADTLRSKAHVRPDAAPAHDVQALAARIAALEQRDRDTAEVIAQLTTQLTALTAAGEVQEARARWFLAAAIGTTALALLAGGLALFT